MDVEDLDDVVVEGIDDADLPHVDIPPLLHQLTTYPGDAQVPSAVPSAEDLGLHIDGVEDEEGPPDGEALGEEDGPDAAAAAPHALKRWLLPPSLTPKKPRPSRMGPPVVVAFDFSVRPDADGTWRCTACATAYDSRLALYAHARFCTGREAEWACEWCGCCEGETPHKASGPNGARTLCSACGQRWRHGHDSMPKQNDKGEWVCASCQRGFPSISALGGHRRFCEPDWRCGWCECKYEDSSGKGPGPAGNHTLCSACSGRYRAGHSGPPPRNEDGKYVCDKCGRTFESIPGLGSHRKRCDGGTWRCAWCTCKSEETSGKGPGPDGGGTLCSTCSSRWRSGHTAPMQQDESGRYPCERCERTFESFRALGVHYRDCDGGSWRCSWCECKASETSGKSPGPDGPRTLCSACASRYRAGHTKPPPRNQDGRCVRRPTALTAPPWPSPPA
jgi:hypothetical protein